MKIVIAPDSFKGSLTAMEVAQAIERGVRKADKEVETVLIPVADGGEGTLDSLVAATNGRKVKVMVMGPLLKPVQAEYGILGDEETCVIEMASASGLCLVQANELNPMCSTSFGTGELILKALNDGCRKFIIGIGGSATNDGGVGMLQALGMKLLDSKQQSIGFGGGELNKLVHINTEQFDSRIAECEFLIASDVQNPLVGINGASAVFGPQKGATPVMVEKLEENLSHWANMVEKKMNIRLHDSAGAGAAGGIGGAFQAFFPSQTKRGIDIVIEYTNLKEKLVGADCVFTGEGQIDFQTASGKTPMGVAQEAQRQGIPVFALAGSVGEGVDVLYGYGITSIHSIVNGPITLQAAMENGAQLLEQSAEQVMRTYLSIVKN